MIHRTPRYHPIWTLGYKLTSSLHSFWSYLWDKLLSQQVFFFFPLWKLTERHPLLIMEQGWVVLQVIYANELSQPDLACKLYLVWTWGLLSKRKIIGGKTWAIISEMAKEFWPGLFMWTMPGSAGLPSNSQKHSFFFSFNSSFFFYSVPDFFLIL